MCMQRGLNADASSRPVPHGAAGVDRGDGRTRSGGRTRIGGRTRSESAWSVSHTGDPSELRAAVEAVFAVYGEPSSRLWHACSREVVTDESDKVVAWTEVDSSDPRTRYTAVLGSPLPVVIVLTRGAAPRWRLTVTSDDAFVHPQVASEIGWALERRLWPGDLERDPRARTSEVVDPPRDPRSPYEAFAEVVASHPQRVALTHAGVDLSYRDLDERCARMGAALRDAGVRDGDRVGICLERGLDLITVVLAIMRAGAVYVPMDPHDPVGRRSYIVGDADLKLVVTNLGSGNFPDGPDLVAPADLELGSAHPSDPSQSHGGYVIYTSGTSGHPKSVEVCRVATFSPWSRPCAMTCRSGRTTCGPCSTRVRSTSRSGRCGGACSPAASSSSSLVRRPAPPSCSPHLWLANR